ncbi:hypothetical protein ACFC06_15560 [Nocardia sp. NPDC056064]|uniref:hypothetical protein n=1 Tax=Nocardia sp. NPDC056064 TaxID=3345701 RepID=UPI0035DE98AA
MFPEGYVFLIVLYGLSWVQAAHTAAYPGQSWPVDSTVAIASLRLHDTLTDARFAPVIDRWLNDAKAHLDPATGLLPHQVSAFDGSMTTAARATSQTIILRFLPDIDPLFAAQQYTRFRAEFLGFPITLPGTKRYAFGAMPIGDAFVAWSATARPLTTAPPPAHGHLHWWWRLPWLLVLTVIAVLPFLGRLTSTRRQPTLVV